MNGRSLSRDKAGTIAPVRVTGIKLNAVTCPTCGVIFGLADHYERLRLEDEAEFHCPNGHTLSYSGGISDAERENIRLQASLDQAEAQVASKHRSGRSRSR